MTITEDIEKGTAKAARFWAAATKYFALIVLIGGTVGGTVYGVLKFWRDTYPPTEPATSTELNEQFDAINSRFTEFGYRDSLYKDSLRVERAKYDSVARIVLVALSDVQARVGRLESGQVSTRLAVEESKRQGQQSSVALIAQINRMSSAEERAKADRERKDQEREARQTAMLEALLRKSKINPETFDTR